MEYNFREIEKRWQKNWKDSGVYKVNNPNDRQEIKPKFYVLDMFPYPSGAGLHVGHPLGYIASDIYARYKRLKGFNVLHPMGYDSFGLPAEQYALETGQHPAVTTEKNIETFRQQLDNIGFSFDWSRELRTSDPKYYKWTQWIFLKLFNSYFCNTQKKARPISELIAKYETKGCNHFTAEEWKAFDEKEKSEWLMKRRLAYSAYGEVNWCEALGTVLANDEVINGVSERGGHPVVKKKMRQWYLRITAYAERLLEGLETVEFSDAMKEMQRNWIGKSEGAEMEFIVSLTPDPPPGGEGKRTSYQTSNLKVWPQLKDLSRENRKEKTLAEDILWQRLKNNQYGSKVRRQHVIDGFIIDFAFLNEKLLIEVDGGYHDDLEQKKYDESRSEYLQQSGYRILRFTNDEVRNNFKKVSEVIKEALAASPLSARRGDGGEAKKSVDFSKPPLKLKVYTTRPDTIFGVDFMVLAPEHELVNEITTDEQRQSIDEYLTYVRSRSDRERMAEVKQVTGCFTGAYAINPFDGRKIPIWIAEYVLAGYGTGAIMAVPCGDQRDYDFAKHFNIPITNIIGEYFNGEEANPTKEATLINSGFLNGIKMKDAIDVVLKKIEEEDIGRRKINYKMRDAGFSRQRYWGEPFPIVYHNGIAYPLDEKDLPIKLPHVENYKPGPEGEGPLANITDWVNLENGDKRETNTMPGYAGSSWYFLRYMDPHNDEEFADRKATDYWSQVDVYVGGTEHAVGHLLYSRMWTKVLFDLGLISFDEPFKKLVNQGMIQGVSKFIYRYQIFFKEKDKINKILFKYQIFVSKNLISKIGVGDEFQRENIIEILLDLIPEFKNHDLRFWELKKEDVDSFSMQPIHVNINYVMDDQFLAINSFINLNPNYSNSIFVTEDLPPRLSGNFSHYDKYSGLYVCGSEVEKMSKSKLNVINPNDLIQKYGADTFRMYEMFLGPVEQSKPWDTKGIEGVHRFLKKLWRLFYDDIKGKVWNEERATNDELKVLHKAIKKIEEDTERFSYNTAVSAFMVCVNELTDLKCHKKEILEPLLILLTPYAPHIAEELFYALGNSTTVLDAVYPKLETKYLIESEKEYPVSINGKMRTTITISLDASQSEVEKIALDNDIVQKWIEGKMPKKIIYVKNKMINVVI
jgi:leucyl-tRNA synthetase